jgi:hypothetical protein
MLFLKGKSAVKVHYLWPKYEFGFQTLYDFIKKQPSGPSRLAGRNVGKSALQISGPALSSFHDKY